jgi:1-acyl-sn-glycerol-3-phosphate acyltransferase
MGAILSFFKQVSRVYFREIEAVGNVPAAQTAGRMFAANHTNGLVDPILVLTQAPCRIAPVAKSTLWKIPVLRRLLDAVDAVPIVADSTIPARPPATTSSSRWGRTSPREATRSSSPRAPATTSPSSCRCAPAPPA